MLCVLIKGTTYPHFSGSLSRNLDFDMTVLYVNSSDGYTLSLWDRFVRYSVTNSSVPMNERRRHYFQDVFKREIITILCQTQLKTEHY